MVFSSITFLFLFLPAVLVGYYVLPRRARNGFLLASSLLFYLWGTGALVLALVASIAANYWLGLRIERAVDGGRLRHAQAWLALAVILNVGLLSWFKYASFAAAQLNQLLGPGLGAELPILEILLPIGISFYTFHSLSYLIDVYRGTARHLVSPLDFGLYITFFPQLVAGPIVRFHEIRDQLVSRRETIDRFSIGVYRFALGFAKKVLVADAVAPLADAAFSVSPDGLTALASFLGVMTYTVQLYFDFSGYSDMAIGLAQMFGIRLPENFARPYAARSVTEFWRRWHMSLSRWFRDYLYIPLGGNRGSRTATYRNLIIVFLATGIWHGANWTFVLWGGYHGVLLLVERALGVGRQPGRDRLWVKALARTRTIALVVFGWIIFRSPDIEHAAAYAGALLRPGFDLPLEMSIALTPVTLMALAVGVGSMLLPGDWVTGQRFEWSESRFVELLRLGAVAVAFPVALVVLVAGDFSPFLYYQF